MLRALSGAYEPDAGQIEIHGQIASLLDLNLGIDPSATGLDNIRLRGRIAGLTAREIEDKLEEIGEFTGLGPFLAMGTCELRRRRERGEPCALLRTLTVWRRNASNIGVFAVVLGVIFLIWARASLVIFALFYTQEMPSLAGFLTHVFSIENIEFLAVYFGVGLLFATLVFALSVVSMPLMLDRNQDAVTAMIASVIALFKSPDTLLLWALIISTLTIIGFATLHLGLIVIVPLIGHASWHAYRDIVAPLLPLSAAAAD